MAGKEVKPANTVQTIGLKFDGGNISYSKGTEYQLGEQYTLEKAGALKLFPKECKFFPGRQFQWNAKIEQYEYFSTAVIVEFSIKGQKFYVSGENFYDSLEKAVLMKNYILNEKKRSK